MAKECLTLYRCTHLGIFSQKVTPKNSGTMGRLRPCLFVFSLKMFCNFHNFKEIHYCKKVNRKVEEVPQSKATVNRKRKMTNWCMQIKHTNAREADRPALSSPREVITMLNRTEKTWKQRARLDSTKCPIVKITRLNKLRITPGSPP